MNKVELTAKIEEINAKRWAKNSELKGNIQIALEKINVGEGAERYQVKVQDIDNFGFMLEGDTKSWNLTINFKYRNEFDYVDGQCVHHRELVLDRPSMDDIKVGDAEGVARLVRFAEIAKRMGELDEALRGMDFAGYDAICSEYYAAENEMDKIRRQEHAEAVEIARVEFAKRLVKGAKVEIANPDTRRWASRRIEVEIEKVTAKLVMFTDWRVRQVKLDDLLANLVNGSAKMVG